MFIAFTLVDQINYVENDESFDIFYEKYHEQVKAYTNITYKNNELFLAIISCAIYHHQILELC